MKRPVSNRLGRKDPFISNGHTTYYRLIGLFVFIILFLFIPVLPATASIVSESFSGSEIYPTGSVVSVKRDLPDDVELAHINNSEYLLGVVNAEDESTITFKKENSNVSVALSGEVRVFVTDANGSVKRGDFIGASWLEGVGMRALPDEQQKLVGIAQEDFDPDTAEEYGEIDTSTGKKNVKINTVLVRLFDKESPQTTSENQRGIEGAFSSVVGKDVSLTKILVGSLLFVVSLTVSALFVTSSIRGSFISIGRNPMASVSIHKGMIRVAFISVVMLLTGATAAYAVLVI
jgi:hypothetical protein